MAVAFTLGFPENLSYIKLNDEHYPLYKFRYFVVVTGQRKL